MSALDLPDWARLTRALEVEADHGFPDLQGHQYRFSEFLQLNLRTVPDCLGANHRAHWQNLHRRSASYSTLDTTQRQKLLGEVRSFLQTLTNSHRPEPPLDLACSLLYWPGIGAKSVEKLASLGLSTLRDLLYYFPRDYLDYSHRVKIRELTPGATVTIVGTVRRCTCFSSPRDRQLTILELLLRDSSGQIRLNRFLRGSRYSNRAWQERQRRTYAPGVQVAASGLVKRGKQGLTLDNLELEVLEGGEGPASGQILPVYPLVEGVGAELLRRTIPLVLTQVHRLPDPLPAVILQQHQLLGLSTALLHIHQPQDQSQLQAARQRLVFDEFFYLQLGLLQRRQERRQELSPALVAPTEELLGEFYRVLPFPLTGAQSRVIAEILADLRQGVPMNRLVQGDVGSGKTVVAVAAILATIQAGHQAAMMVPTEVLAAQHYQKLLSWFNLLHLPVELLTGSTGVKKRREVLQQLSTGELPLVVGTHALIEDPVCFRSLGLVVIDEQHRFGVEQRARLQQKGIQPHVLTLTATPIPRTLALTIHGDLDTSQIDELPPGRQRITTKVYTNRQRSQAYNLIHEQVRQGHQAYIVLPLVEESEKLDLKSAVAEHQRLQTEVFPDYRLGLLHGRLHPSQKQAALEEFRLGLSQILVSTTVVEVGVDMPNATVMLVEHGERFGLAQLHQLRGRVGRGADQSYCLILSSSTADPVQQRLKVLEQSQDGFLIAEMDLRFRGPGQVLGTRQSGLPDFVLAHLVQDQPVLELARTAAETLMTEDPSLQRWLGLVQELKQRYRQLLGGSIFT